MRFQTFSPLIAGSILGTVSVNPLALMALALIDTVARTFKGQTSAAQGDTCTSCSRRRRRLHRGRGRARLGVFDRLLLGLATPVMVMNDEVRFRRNTHTPDHRRNTDDQPGRKVTDAPDRRPRYGLDQ